MQMDSKCRVQKVFGVGLNDLIAAVNLQFLKTTKSPALLLKILEHVSTINTILITITLIFTYNLHRDSPKMKQAKNTFKEVFPLLGHKSKLCYLAS